MAQGYALIAWRTEHNPWVSLEAQSQRYIMQERKHRESL